MTKPMQRMAGCVSIALMFLVAGGLSAQPPGPGPFSGFGGSTEMLLRPDVRKELELVDDQVRQLEQLGSQSRDRLREMFTQMRDVPREERMEKVRSLMAEFREQTQQQVNKILLPHQLKRLEQLSLQFRLRGGPIRSLASEGITEELGISDEQKERLQSKAQELENQLREKIAQLRAEAQNELLKILTIQQRETWQEMVGEPFDFAPGELEALRRGGRLGGRPRGSEPSR